MSRVLSLALKINADASGVKLTPVERALKKLGDETTKVTSVFEKFGDSSEAAARAQAQTTQSINDLIAARRAGTVTAEEFAKQFAAVAEGAKQEAAALERAARITEANLSPLERYDRALEELDEQLKAGRISQETYARATESAAKGLTDAERAARGLAVQQKEIDNAATNTTLKFNELSGVFSVLPGPLGNIAGRISGIASASEGLSRVFSGGLSQGIGNIASSFTALLNPTTLAVAGIAGFGAAASAVVSGLTSLEDRVEKLGNVAAKLGVSFGFVQTLEESARRSGTSIDAVSAAFGRLQKSVLGVDEESKAAQKALAEIGVTAAELQALSPEEQYQKIGRALADIEDPARRTATATALFGKAGTDLIPFFNNLPGAANDIERFGRVISDLDKRRIDEFGLAMDGLAVASQGLGQSLLIPFAGLGEGIATALAEITAGITAIVDPIGRILEPLLTQIGRNIEYLGTQLGNVGRVIGAVFEPFAEIVQAVFVALEPLLDGILDFLKSVSDAAVSTAEWLISFTPIGAIASNVGALGETISRVVTIITTAFQRVGEFVGGLVSRFGELIAQSPFLQTLGEVVSSVFGSVASVFSTIANAIGGTVGRLLTLAENFLGIDRSAQQAAEATQNLGKDIEELTEEERKQAEERDKFFQGFTDNVSKAIDESAKFGQAGFDAAFQYQNSIAELQRQFDQGIGNEESFKRAAEQANEAYKEQIDTIRRAAEETERKAQAEIDAVDRLIEANERFRRTQSQFGGDDARLRASENLVLIYKEFERAEKELAKVRQSGDEEAIFAAEQRLRLLGDAAARERDIASGRAAQRKAQEEEAARRIKQNEEIANRRLQAEKEVERQIAAERDRVNQFVNDQLALAQFGGNQQRLQASRQVAEIEREIARVQAEVNAARQAGNTAAANAGVARIAQLDQVAAKERDIASGRAEAEAKTAEKREKALEAERNAAEERQRAIEQQQQAAKQAAEAQRKAFEEQAKAAAAEAARQEKRIRALNSIGQQSIGVGDIRSTEGARTFIQAAAGALDPNAVALAEARKQSKLLAQIVLNSGVLPNLARNSAATFTFLGGGA